MSELQRKQWRSSSLSDPFTGTVHRGRQDHVPRSLSPEQRDLATNSTLISSRSPTTLSTFIRLRLCLPRKFPSLMEVHQVLSYTSFTPSSAIDPEKERDWAANLGMPLLPSPCESQYETCNHPQGCSTGTRPRLSSQSEPSSSSSSKSATSRLPSHLATRRKSPIKISSTGTPA